VIRQSKPNMRSRCLSVQLSMQAVSLSSNTDDSADNDLTSL